ncbi:MAG: hypothetical protein ACE5FA_03175 [Dehalococcoidia bacterium]
MPNYRLYYAERSISPEDRDRIFGKYPKDGHYDVEVLEENHWEENIEARDPYEALDSFFRDHLDSRSMLMWIDNRQRTHAAGEREVDLERTYIWIEEDMLMELQAVEEGTPGMVSCPLCEGVGEIDEATADEFAAAVGDGEEETFA